MRPLKPVALAALALLSFACDEPVGGLRLALEISGANDRSLTVDFGGQPRSFTVANVILLIDGATLVPPEDSQRQNVSLIGARTPFVFGADGVREIELEAPIGDYFVIDLALGLADAGAAAAAGEPDLQDRTFHLEGSLDTDGDGVEESNIVVSAPAAQALSFDGVVSVFEGQVATPTLVLDLERLVAGVDFSLAEPIDGVLALTEDNTVDQTPQVSANVSTALSLE